MPDLNVHATFFRRYNSFSSYGWLLLASLITISMSGQDISCLSCGRGRGRPGQESGVLGRAFIPFSINIKESSIMMENNQLYRRIQTNNLFRTFSKAYARHTDQRCPPTAPDSTCHPSTATQPHERTGLRSCLDQRRVTSLNSTTQQDYLQARTAPVFIKTEQSLNSRIPSSQTVNLTGMQSRLGQGQSYSGSSYLNGLIAKRKDSDSILVNLKERHLHENFKPKSCMLKQGEQYEGQQDETEFSTLNLEKKLLFRKSGRWRARGTIPSVATLQHLRRVRETNSALDRRAQADVFSRYVNVSDSFRSREAEGGKGNQEG